MESSGAHHHLLAGAVVICVTALAACMVLVLGSDSEQPGPAQAANSGANSAEATGAGPDLGRTLGVFRRERTAHDIVPGDPNALLQESGDGRPGESPDLSRRIDLPSGPVYLWPMTDGVCHATYYLDGCVRTQTLEDRGVSLSTSSNVRIADASYQDLKVFGVVREGIGEVRFTLTDKSEVSAVVRDNVFMLDLESPPTQMRWSDQAGSHVEPLAGQSAKEIIESVENARSSPPARP